MRWITTKVVLLVDSDDEVLCVLKTALQYTDYVPLQAKTGQEALAVLSRLRDPIDLTILDLDLPSDDGLVISLLTILDRRKTTKIIVKTFRQDKPFLDSVTYFGIDAIILKPIAEEQLIKTVQEMLSGHRNSSAVVSAGSAA
jgi:DNA-binding response OmpR family regulator